MTTIAFDPSYAKPVAYAYRTGRVWRVGSIAPRDKDELRTVLADAVQHNISECVIEDGYVGVNRLVAMRLEAARQRLADYAEMYDLSVRKVHPKTWQAACLSQSGRIPKTHPALARAAKMYARDLTRLDLDEDEACAVCMAHWGNRTERD